MPEILSPGVLVTEVDFSSYVRSLSTSVFGVVGVFEKGPVNKATLVTSLEDARRKFGGYMDAQGYLAMLSLKNFFENGGSVAWVVRVTSTVNGESLALPSEVTIADRAAEAEPTLLVSAATPGTWGDALSVEVAASEVYPTTGVTLRVRQNGVLVDVFKDVLVGAAHVASADYVEKRVNGVSPFIKVTDVLSPTASPDNLPELGEKDLSGGDDGLAGITIQEFIGDAAHKTGLSALDEVAINFLAVPGEADDLTGDTLGQALVAYAEGRKDCMALIEAPQGLTAQQVVEWRKAAGFNSSYAALYAGWLLAKHPVTGREIALPPSGFVAGVYASTDRQVAVWAAPAGLNRGVVRGASGPETRFSRGELDLMYEAGVNPITLDLGSLIVLGQKTLQLRASATDRVNVRRLLIYIEQAIGNSGKFFVHEPNMKVTWEAFKREVNPFLRRIKDRDGLVDFLVVCDETINTPADQDRNVMHARIMVKPPRTAEFFNIEFAIAPSGASFTEL
jgi:uncharacterized protein